jgi:hypothetical protein
MWLICEQTAISSLHSTNVLVFITQMLCLLRGTNWVFKYNTGQLGCKCISARTEHVYCPIWIKHNAVHHLSVL